MKRHKYKIKLDWSGDRGLGTANYQAYKRDHLISGDKKTSIIQGSSDPDFLGDPTRFNPEELFLSSIASCHMLWYLHLCATNGIVVVNYIDHPIGIMIETEDGSGQFENVTLYPKVVINSEEMIEKAIALHELAHKKCFIARSCNFEILQYPTVTVK